MNKEDLIKQGFKGFESQQELHDLIALYNPKQDVFSSLLLVGWARSDKSKETLQKMIDKQNNES